MAACSGNKANKNDANNEIKDVEENVDKTTETAIDSSETTTAVVDTTDTTNVPANENEDEN